MRICDSAGDSRTLRLQLVAEIRQVVGFEAYALQGGLAAMMKQAQKAS